MRFVRFAPLLVLPAFLVMPACRSDDASPDPGGLGGGASIDAKEAGAGGRDGSATGGAGGGAGDASLTDAIAPSGPRTVTLLHGLTDSPWIAFCFSKVEDGVEGPLAPELFPSGGLLYGASVLATDLPGGARFGDDSVRPYVVAAASEDVVRGLDCRAIAARTGAPPVDDAGARVPPEGGAPDAGSAVIGDGGAPDGGDAGAPPAVRIADVRMAALPVLPARALSPEESYLVAIAGCLGGPGVTAPAEVSICGAGYSVNAPTLATSVVRLSRETAPRAAGLQFLVATPAFGQADLRLIPPLGDPIVVAKGVGVGALRPVQPYLDASGTDIGAGSPGARVQVTANGSTLAAYDEPWDPTLAAGGIEALLDGQTYTLVLLGPTPGFAAAQWWNGALVTIVQNTE